MIKKNDKINFFSASHCKKWKQESEELFLENKKLQKDIETLFHELELMAQIVFRCSNYIPKLINLLFKSSIGERTLSHVNKIPENSPNSQNLINLSFTPTLHTKVNGDHLQLKPLGKLYSPQFLKMERNSDNSTNLDEYLSEAYNSVRRKRDNLASKESKTHACSGRDSVNSSIYENVGFSDEFKQALTVSNDSKNGKAHENSSLNASQQMTIPKKANDSRNTFIVKSETSTRTPSVPLFEDETEKKLETVDEISTRSNLNESFSKTENGCQKMKTNKLSMRDLRNLNHEIPETAIEVPDVCELHDSRTEKDLSVDLSKATLERVKSDFITSFRQQIRQTKQTAQSNGALNLNTSLQNCDNSFTSTKSVKTHRKSRRNKTKTSPKKLEQILNESQISISDLLESSSLFSNRLIHLQSNYSVVPEKLQGLLKRDPIAQLIRVLNELEAVIKVHVNSIYLKYII